MKHQKWLIEHGKNLNLKDAFQVLERLNLQGLLEKPNAGYRAKFSKEMSIVVKTAQIEELQSTLVSKKIHGIFYEQCSKSEDT